jgi:hypothetical protein
MFSTLDFKTKGSSYSNAYRNCLIEVLEFEQENTKEIGELDSTHHYKKSFMKTYEEIKLKHNIVIRK